MLALAKCLGKTKRRPSRPPARRGARCRPRGPGEPRPADRILRWQTPKAAMTISDEPHPAPPSPSPAPRNTGRERVGRAAYELFSKDGVRAVGVDAIIAQAGTAKMTLYRNFPSKNDLIIDFLQRRERLWTREGLEAESRRRGATPREQLLAIFDVFAEWFARPDRKRTRL